MAGICASSTMEGWSRSPTDPRPAARPRVIFARALLCCPTQGYFQPRPDPAPP